MPVSSLTPGPPERPSPRPLNSLVAAAATMTGRRIERDGAMVTAARSQGWQEDAWDMHDLVGEQRFLAHTLANRMAQARFFVARLPEDSTEDLIPITEGTPLEVFDSLAGARAAFAQMIERTGVNLFIAGDGYLLGAPRRDAGPTDGVPPVSQGDLDMEGIALDDLDWSMRSVSEVNFNASGEIEVATGGRMPDVYSADSVVLIRIWRPHPRRWWEADSPTRSSLPVLRELVGLTMHISAQVDSRLAGAGVLFVPETADQALRAQLAAGGAPADESDISPFITALMDAMLTPIKDRSSASALVPIMPVVPDESIEKFRHMSFASPLDPETRSLRDEAIRRLALGQDCPPELLLGVGSMNHWGAWLVREDVVTSHLEPPLALVCDALTTQFLWPVLEQHGVADFRDYVIWYDVSELIIRPDRSNDAKALHAAGVISDASLRLATGFDDTDAPQKIEALDPAVRTALDLISKAPSLAQTPGLATLVEQIRAVLSGEDLEPPQGDDQGQAGTPAESPDDPAEGPPSTSPSDLPDDIAASGALTYRPPVAVPFPHEVDTGTGSDADEERQP